MKYIKHIIIIFMVFMFTVCCASAFVSVPTITDGIGFQYQDITIGNNKIQIGETNITKGATFVVAASNSLHPEGADFICDGVNDQVQIQAAIDGLSMIGGEVQLTEGRFYISSPIRIVKNGVCLSGMGQAWGYGGTAIELTDHSDCNMIEIGHATNHIFFSTIEDLYLFGDISQQASGKGILVDGDGGVTDLILRNIAIDRMCTHGISIAAGMDAWLYTFTDVWVEYCGGSGLSCYSGDPRCTNCAFLWNDRGITSGNTNVACVNCDLSYNKREGIWMGSGGTLRLIGSSLIMNSKLSSGSYSDVRLTSLDYGSIIGNIFNGAGTTLHGVDIEAATTRVVVSDNVFGSHASSPIVNTAGNAAVIRDNFGFITENSGTVTLNNGIISVTVVHGLDVTPVAGDIMVTAMESLGSASYHYIDTYTPTTFNITVNADPTQDVNFAWSAAIY